jgi:hypothetical protein
VNKGKKKGRAAKVKRCRLVSISARPAPAYHIGLGGWLRLAQDTVKESYSYGE